ncbi:MAG: hypothetical protein RLZZ341_2728 [Pseudomonadota bacterium]
MSDTPPSSPGLAPGTRAQAVWRHPEFSRGARDMLTTSIGIGAWGLITGVAMGNSGLPMPLMLMMSLLVFAGSAQLATLPLLISGAPVLVVWATALCVNLRFLIFSAHWRPYFAHLGRRRRVALSYFMADLNYVLFMRRFPDARPAPEQVPYLLGGASINWLSWQVPSIVGLLGVGLSLVSDRFTAVAGAVAGCAAVAAYALPLKLNILVAIAAAVAIGVLMDHASPRKAAEALPSERRP